MAAVYSDLVITREKNEKHKPLLFVDSVNGMNTLKGE
jgi:hypothetical protein